ncbi:hypothetical protein BXZ70DRAFT_329149 [Cristinia sonorae]|uniref:UBA domain-containing protein n=1 Tax=Cristinia sonorae TaxID=1940300 RepID=A0A8K0UMA9_9AGAR|nr:hypothetical protein BXZ70DRAFT_329149 [Cristinia sonorae]
MEGRDVDLLFGLDMLKAHQACIDLEKNVLRIQNREVKFLAEHELPDKARSFEAGIVDDQPAADSATPQGQSSAQFPGSGSTLGSAPASVPSAVQPQAASSRFPEAAITTLMGLGATRELAISSLEAAGGNVDIAASFLFQ